MMLILKCLKTQFIIGSTWDLLIIKARNHKIYTQMLLLLLWFSCQTMKKTSTWCVLQITLRCTECPARATHCQQLRIWANFEVFGVHCCCNSELSSESWQLQSQIYYWHFFHIEQGRHNCYSWFLLPIRNTRTLSSWWDELEGTS